LSFIIIYNKIPRTILCRPSVSTDIGASGARCSLQRGDENQRAEGIGNKI